MAEWQYRQATEPRYAAAAETRYAGGERYPNGGERYAPEQRRTVPSPVSKRPRREYGDAYDDADELPSARGTPYAPRATEREVGYAPRADRGYEDRNAPRNTWRDQEPLPASELVYSTNLTPGLASQLGLQAGGVGGLPLALPEDMFLGPAGGRALAQMDARTLVINGGAVEQERSALDLLPPDASATLFVDGLPVDCSKREAAHIFRPFIGYKEVRLVHKEAKRAAGEKVVLCFVEFADARCAATALEALQGYRFDELERDSPALRLTFARNPGPRGPSSREDGYRSGYRSDYRDDDYRGRRR